MARTQSPDYDKRREAILAQAARLYAKHGFLGASVSDLAKACKTSKSLIYHYYPSKEDILYDVMSAHLDDLVAIAVAAMATPGIAAAQRLNKLTQEFMQVYIGAVASHKVLLNELGNLPTLKRNAIVARQREIIARVEALLIDIRPELASHKNLQRPIAMLYFGMINWTHTWFSARGAVSAKKLAGMATEILLAGLRDVRLVDHPS